MSPEFIKKKSLKKNNVTIRRAIFFLFLSLLISACGNKKEGCIDVNAVNFDVSAEENCCCVYPRMGLDVEYYNGDRPLADSVLLDAAGDTVLIDKLTFFISGLLWTNERDEELRGDQRTWLFLTPDNYHDSTRCIDDYYLIRSSGSKVENFTFTQSTVLRSLSLTIGVADSGWTNQPFYMKDANHVLAGNIDSMYDYSSNQYRTLRLAYRLKNSADKADTIYVGGKDTRKNFKLNLNYHTVLGFNNYVIIRIRLDKLIKGIRFRMDDPETITQKLKENISDAIIQ